MKKKYYIFIFIILVVFGLFNIGIGIFKGSKEKKNIEYDESKIIIGDIQKDVIKMLERYDSSNYHLNIYYKVNKTDRNVLIEYNNNVEKITIDNNSYYADYNNKIYYNNGVKENITQEKYMSLLLDIFRTGMIVSKSKDNKNVYTFSLNKNILNRLVTNSNTYPYLNNSLVMDDAVYKNAYIVFLNDVENDTLGIMVYVNDELLVMFDLYDYGNIENISLPN